eukprot:COSAG01_NODE_1603_length_9758_cov_7.506471_4_plen_380_part_00
MGVSLNINGKLTFGAVTDLEQINRLVHQLQTAAGPTPAEKETMRHKRKQCLKKTSCSTGELEEWTCDGCGVSAYTTKDLSWQVCYDCDFGLCQQCTRDMLEQETTTDAAAVSRGLRAAPPDLPKQHQYYLDPTEYLEEHELEERLYDENPDIDFLNAAVSLDELNILATLTVAKIVFAKQVVTVGCGMRDEGSLLSILPLQLVKKIFGFIIPVRPLALPTVIKNANVRELSAAITQLGGTPVEVDTEYSEWQSSASHLTRLTEQLHSLHYAEYHNVEFKFAVTGGDYFRSMGSETDGLCFILVATGSLSAATPSFAHDFRGWTRQHAGEYDSVGFVSPLGTLTVPPGAAEALENHLGHLISKDGHSPVGWQLLSHASYG